MGGRGRLAAAVTGMAAGLAVIMAVTAPPVDEEVEATVRRSGGVCLQLERWTPFGWATVGQTHSVADIRNSLWRPSVENPPCAAVPEREYLIRIFAEPPGIYRMCGLADDNACMEFRRVAP